MVSEYPSRKSTVRGQCLFQIWLIFSSSGLFRKPVCSVSSLCQSWWIRMDLLQSCKIYPQLCGLVPFKTFIKYGWHLSWSSSCEVSPVHLDSVSPSVKFICHPAEIEWIQKTVRDLAERHLFLLWDTHFHSPRPVDFGILITVYLYKFD